MPSSNNLLTTGQVARILDVSTRTVARLVEDERLSAAVQAPGKRGAFMFDPSEVEQCRVIRELQAKGKKKPATSKVAG